MEIRVPNELEATGFEFHWRQ